MSEAAQLSQADVERIAQRTAELIQQGGARVAPTTLGIAELQVKLNCGSPSAVYRTLDRLGVKAFAPGKYYAADIETAIARKSYNARRPGK